MHGMPTITHQNVWKKILLLQRTAHIPPPILINARCKAKLQGSDDGGVVMIEQCGGDMAAAATATTLSLLDCSSTRLLVVAQRVDRAASR
jgi:hypothetical protein